MPAVCCVFRAIRVPDDGGVVEVAEDVKPLTLEVGPDLPREATLIPAVDPVIVAELGELTRVYDHVVELEGHADLRDEVLVETAERVAIPEILVLVQLSDKSLTEAVGVDLICVFAVQALVEALDECVDEVETSLRLVEIDVVIDSSEVFELVVVVRLPVVVWRHRAVSGRVGCNAAYER